MPHQLPARPGGACFDMGTWSWLCVVESGLPSAVNLNSTLAWGDPFHHSSPQFVPLSLFVCRIGPGSFLGPGAFSPAFISIISRLSPRLQRSPRATIFPNTARFHLDFITWHSFFSFLFRCPVSSSKPDQPC